MESWRTRDDRAATEIGRLDVVQAFLDRHLRPTYLEIGVRTGTLFVRLRARRKLAVDPTPRIGFWKRLRWWFRNPSNRRSRVYRMTSDEFFARDPGGLRSVGLEVAFIDGLHTYAQSLRDVENCLALLNPGGAVLMHDCSPPSRAAATPALSPGEARRKAGEAWDGRWCGDVYKTILHLRSQRPDLRVGVLDCDRGIGVIRPGEAGETLEIDPERIARLDYADLERNRRRWLGLRPPESLADMLGS